MNHIQTYKEAIDYTFGLTSAKTQLNKSGLHLKRIKSFLNKVDNPQFKYPVIHVGGTAGKGSTCYLIASILSELGLKVGIHTSPNLVKINEKFQIIKKDREFHSCTNQDFVDLVNWFLKNNKKYEQTKNEPLTFYEMITAMVFRYFEIQKVDVAVVEVAMGGRLDATNVVNSEIAVLNSVGFDHMEFLGDTLEKITWDKMQIMKPRKTFISGLRDTKLNNQIIKHSKLLKTNLKIIGRDFEYEILKSNLEGSIFEIQNPTFTIQNLVLPLVGDYQVHNACLAIQAVGLFYGFKNLNSEIITRAFRKVNIRARFDIISKKPLIILDGAHNELKIRKLVEFLSRNKILNKKPLILLLGITEGKEAEKMINLLAKLNIKKIILTEFKKQYYKEITSYKTEYLHELIRNNKKINATVEIEKNPVDAFSKLISSTNDKEYALVTGSLYLLGKIYENM